MAYELEQNEELDVIDEDIPTIEDFDQIMTQFAQDSYSLTKGYNNYNVELIRAATENIASYAELLNYFAQNVDFEPAKREREERDAAKEKGQIYVPKNHIQLA